jgi:hypothetical protein
LITGSSISDCSRNYKCLVHLDRLSITFLHFSGSTFQNRRNPDYISEEQVYNDITLRYENSPGIGAYYHTFTVYYSGLKVGRLHSGSKMKKSDIQFDFEKELFYSIKPDFWFDIYIALQKELGIIPNNINCLEIAVDTDKNLLEQFGYYYQNAENNQFGKSGRYRMRKNTQVHVMNNGLSFVIAGSENKVSIYNKSNHAEDYIKHFFKNNGLSGNTVNRIESRLNWNYIRYIRSRKKFNIDVDSLLDPGKLVTIFKISTKNKITFLDQQTKAFDRSRNPYFSKVSIVDDLPLESSEIGQLNASPSNKHYKTEFIDENILRQNYYKFLDTGNQKYFRNFKISGDVAGYNRNKILSFIVKFNCKYKGNRTLEVTRRMEFAHKNLSHRLYLKLNVLLYLIEFKLKWNFRRMF